MTADATIDYDGLQQEAQRGIVRAVLQQVAKSGLPGDHHLYISFDVRAPGVVLSKRLREKYPSEMTIVLQYRFWDLLLTDDRFEVKLTFDGIPERLVVPYNAIKVFIDPSVRFVLHFEEPQAVGGDDRPGDSDGSALRTNGARPGQAKRPRPPRPRPRAEREGGPAPALTAVPASPAPVASTNPAGTARARPPVPPLPAARPPEPATTANASEDRPAEVAPGGGAQVVSLDAFRKK